MSAVEALKAARAAGMELALDGDDLAVSAALAPRKAAEAQAFECCVVEWLNRHPVCSPPGRCLGCGGNENTYDQLLPYGAEPTGHAWLHSSCWEAWHANRKATAAAVLSLTLGVG